MRAGGEPSASENGDANGDGRRDIGDAVYLLSWLFQGGPEPVPVACAGAPTRRSIAVPAQAISVFRPVESTRTGLVWPAGFTSTGSVSIPIPDDWSGARRFDVTIFFAPTSNAAGNVDFFLRPVGRSLGDNLADPGSVGANPVIVPAGSSNQLFQQTFTVPASNLDADNSMLHLYLIQRGGENETFEDDVMVYCLEVSYPAE